MTSASEQSPLKDWCNRQLHDLCYVVGGGTPSRSQPKYWNGDIPWASVKDFSDEVVFLYDTKEHITQEGLESSASTLIQANVPVVCTRMAVGRCTLTTRPTAINQDLKALLLRDGFDSRFFIRLLKFHGSTLDRVSVGSTVRGITTHDLLSLALSYPDKSEQSRIAAVLDTVDEAIANTEAVIAKLKQVRDGLLHDLLTCGLDENGQLRDPIAHPEQFQDSPLGRIPREWNTRPLDSVGRWAGGKTPSKDNAEFWYQGEVLWVTPKDVKFDEVEDTEDKLSVLGASTMEVFRAGSLLVVGRSGILRHSLPVAIATKPFTVNQDLKVLVPFVADETTAPFLRLVLVSREQEVLRRTVKTGTTVESIDWPVFKNLLVGWPSPAERRIICDFVSKVDADITYSVSELEKLAQLKSGLMSDLLTGRVRVPEDIAVVP
jgi:type I restriction enzyme S subunit